MKLTVVSVAVLAVIIFAVVISNLRTATKKDIVPIAGTPLSLSDVSPGTYSKTTESDGQMRTYKIHIPTGYDPTVPTPLVFILHGGMGNGGQILAGTKFAEKADAETFIVVAPDGVDNNWNDGRGTTVQGNNDVINNDDVAFISNLIEEFKTVYTIDPARIYTAGISNGSMMSQRLACELPNVFAAIGAVAGPFRGDIADSCNSSVSVIGIQGTDDPFFPMEDGNGIPELPFILKRNNVVQTVTSIEEVAQIWVAGNSCDAIPIQTALPAVVDDGTSVTKYSYTGCTEGRNVEYYQVKGMGHSWPPATRSNAQSPGGPSSQNINATDIIWDFFASHTK